MFGWLNSDDQLEPGAFISSPNMRQPISRGAGRSWDTAGRSIASGKVVYYKEPGELTLRGRSAAGAPAGTSCSRRASSGARRGRRPGRWTRTFTLRWMSTSGCVWCGKVRFQRIDALLSTALAHAQAKTTALRDEMLIETAARGDQGGRRGLHPRSSWWRWRRRRGATRRAACGIARGEADHCGSVGPFGDAPWDGGGSGSHGKESA